MMDTATIGRVTAVDSRDLRVTLDLGSTGFTKVGTDGLVTVGVVNSYITVPSGAHRVVAIVTGVSIARDNAGPGSSVGFVRETDTGLYELAATVVGRFEDGVFRSGLTGYPPLNSPVYVASPEEVRGIFIPSDVQGVRIGTSAASSEQDVHLDGNLLLSHHCAIVGSTGSGKSCTVTAVLDSLLDEGIDGGHIVIFDINGEYADAFAPDTARGQRTRTVVLGPEPGTESGLFLPHWFMNNEEHLELLRASEGVQAPVLQRAIADARSAGMPTKTTALLLENIAASIDIIDSAATDQRGLENTALQLMSLKKVISEYKLKDTSRMELWVNIENALFRTPTLVPVKFQGVGADDRIRITIATAAVRALLTEAWGALGMGSKVTGVDFDAPVFYSLQALCDQFLPARVRREENNDNRITSYVATLQMRLSRLLADGRYEFMTRVEKHDDPLGTYLRMLLGEDPTKGEASSKWPARAQLEDQKSSHGEGPSVTIFDLSLVASDVLASVTGLLGRLIFDFSVRMQPRADHPVLLVLEEAHRFVPARVDVAGARSAAVFERIAKEGRKFGLSLLLASQRPSELSETVIAQCGTVIAHRLTHEADQNLLRHATALSSRALLEQLPGLAQQHALITGVSTGVPVAVRIRDVEDRPRSKDPKFLESWKTPRRGQLANDIDRLAALWEG